MKNIIFILAIFLAACNTTSQENLPVEEEVALDYYLGSWALTIDYGDNNAGWLDIRMEDGYLDADLLWRWGSVEPVEFVHYDNDKVTAYRGVTVEHKKDGEEKPLRVHHLQNAFTLEKVGEDEIKGIATFPDRSGIGSESVAFTGKKLPPAGEAPDLESLEYGDPIALFNGEDLTGWEMLREGSVNGWKVEDGILINDPVQKEGEPHISYGNLRTVDSFEDFKLELDVNVPEGSNSGVYLRGIYEIQVLDSHGKELDSHNMGALYSRITPLVSAEKPAGEWQHMEITLVDRHVTVVLNGFKIIDNQFVGGVTGGAMHSDEFVPGPIYLQGDHGKVMYRDIVLTPVL